MADVEAVKGVCVARDEARLVIRWRRWNRQINGCRDGVGEAIFFLIGLGFFGFPVAGCVSQVMRLGRVALGWGDLVAVPFALIGGFVVYRTLTLLINTDVVQVTSEALKVRSVPLPPWDMETPTIPLQQVARIECKVKALSSRRAGHAGVTRNHDVVAVMLDGKTRDVITGSTASEPAYFVAHEIAQFIKRA